MEFDRVFRQVQAACDLLVGIATRQLRQHFQFALAEDVTGRVVVAAKAFEQGLDGQGTRGAAHGLRVVLA